MGPAAARRVPRPTALPLLLLALLLPACATVRQSPVRLVAGGEFGRARAQVARQMTHDRKDRQYLLDRMKLGMLTLADGYPAAAEPTFQSVYDILRTQGINEDKTVASVVINEDIKFWKGEPFEQALGMFYYSMLQAELDSWDNARAAAASSLFTLRDFGSDPKTGERLDTADIAQRALAYERAQAGVKPEAGDEYLDKGYAVRESNFTLGYLMHGLASRQLGRIDEANDYLDVAGKIDSALQPLVSELRRGGYNAVLLVSYGLGPEKVAYGPDNTLTRFAPRTASDNGSLLVRVGNAGESTVFPQALDVNRMAADHMWNNLEDVRRAKSLIGSVLLTGGVVSTAYGVDQHNEAALYAGLGALATGAFLKAGAHADTAYLDVVPQRYYLVPLRLDGPNQSVEVQVEAVPGSRLVLTGLSPPRDPSGLMFRYVRLLSPRYDSPTAAPEWATRGQVYYSNPVTGFTDAPQLPYILGGNSVMPPTTRALERYQADGFLTGLTTSELRNIYNEEGLILSSEGLANEHEPHVLEGGKSMVSPLGGTTGFVRLMNAIRPEYRPTSTAGKAWFVESESRP